MYQSFAVERRTCKHLRKLRGEAAEKLRVGGPLARAVAAAAAAGVPLAMTATPVTMKLHAGGAPPLLLAHKWESDVDPAGWWLSEKLDGVRAYWNGKRLLSRLGNTLFAPDWFLGHLPAELHLDGELFGGRGQFQRTVSIVRREGRSHLWEEIRFVIFDAPMHDAELEGRLQAVASYVARTAAEHVVAHPHARCKGLAHLKEELSRVEALGGEGLMMRKPGSRYESGRSTTLLKVKTFHDAEARVVGHRPGQGKHLGRLGRTTTRPAVSRRESSSSPTRARRAQASAPRSPGKFPTWGTNRQTPAPTSGPIRPNRPNRRCWEPTRRHAPSV